MRRRNVEPQLPRLQLEGGYQEVSQTIYLGSVSHSLALLDFGFSTSTLPVVGDSEDSVSSLQSSLQC